MSSRVTWCRYHRRSSDPFGLGTCERGHDIDAMVGPDFFGIRLRMPCAHSDRSEPVYCPDVDHSGHEEREAAVLADLRKIEEENACPKCGKQLVGNEKAAMCHDHPDVFIIRCSREDIGHG